MVLKRPKQTQHTVNPYLYYNTFNIPLSPIPLSFFLNGIKGITGIENTSRFFIKQPFLPYFITVIFNQGWCVLTHVCSEHKILCSGVFSGRDFSEQNTKKLYICFY